MANKFDPQRLRQIELILTWEGQLGNARLREVFRLTPSRVSQWIREFREAYPGWTRWDSVARTFNATHEFYRDKNQKDAASLAEYLSLVGLHSANDPDSQQAVVAAFPEITTPKPQIFALLSNAARLERMVEITYRSMSEPAPHKRVISPHSVVRAGRRWHVRAYCDLNKQFRDYALGRIVNVKLLDQSAELTIKDDKDWLTMVPVKLVAHPDMTPEQESLIHFEYFNNTSANTISCRGPLVNYFIQDVRAAIDVKTQRPPEYQLAVWNVKEVSPWLCQS